MHVPDDVTVDTLGIASPATAITTATILDGIEYVVTRSVHPTVIAGYDIRDGQIISNAEIPHVDGSWASVALNGAIYIGTYQPAELHRYDPGTNAVDRLTTFPDDEFIWDLETDGQTLFAGTYPTGRVVEIDPISVEQNSLAHAPEGEAYIRSLSVTAETIYAGVGSHAALLAINRNSDAQRQLLPDRFRAESFVYDVVTTESAVIGGTSPNGHLVVVDRSTGELMAASQPISESSISKLLATQDGEVFVGAKRTESENELTSLLRLRSPTGSVESIGDFPGSCIALGVNQRRIYGASSNGVLWECEFDGSQSQTVSVADVGMPLGAERPQSITSVDGDLIVGGHSQFTLHRAGIDEPQSISVPGEPKTLAVNDNTIYAGLYTGAHLVALDPKRERVTHLETVGNAQNRPRALEYHPASHSLLLGTAPEYGHLGGAISQYSLASETLSVNRHIVPNQSIHAIAIVDERVVLGSDIHGGSGIEPTSESATIVTWDPLNSSILESRDLEGVKTIVSLAMHSDRLYATTRSSPAHPASSLEESSPNNGELIVLDPDDQSISSRVPLGPSPGELIEYRGHLYAITDDLYMITSSGECLPVVTGLESHWFNWPMACPVDESLYTLAGWELVRLKIPDTPRFQAR